MSAKPRRSPVGDARFFIALENGHPVAAACKAAGYTRGRVYVWRREDPAFAEQWQTSCAIACDLIEEEADRLGRDGYEEAVFYQGRHAGTRRKYSDGLLLARLKALDPERYRDNRPVETKPQNPYVVTGDFRAEETLRQLIDANRLSPFELDERLRKRVLRHS